MENIRLNHSTTMSDGERLEIYKPRFQDPKERRKNKAKIVKNS